jgi:hypothetical protein
MKKTGNKSTDGEGLHLGKLLGHREAFELIAARCPAADAASLRAIRDGKSVDPSLRAG